MTHSIDKMQAAQKRLSKLLDDDVIQVRPSDRDRFMEDFRQVNEDLKSVRESLEEGAQCSDMLGDCKTALTMIAEVIGLSPEPHQTWRDRLFEELQALVRDAGRYRFLRDEDQWGSDNDVEVDSYWGLLGESTLGDFDKLVDNRILAEMEGTND